MNISVNMVETYIVRFSFSTPLHIGNERSDYASGEAFVQSDTLLAAIYHAWARLGKSHWIDEDVCSDAPLLVSSMFPTVADKNGNHVYFLPKPIKAGINHRDNNLDTATRKKLKKVKWIDTAMLYDELAGKTQPAEDFIYGTFRSKNGALQYPFLKSKVVPRVMVPRQGGDTTIYYIERHYFCNGAGLYAFVQSNDEGKKRLRAALNLLAEEGLGTDRNVGNGKFGYAFENRLPLKLSGGDYGMALGMYCPAHHDELTTAIGAPFSAYDMVKRGGWLSEPYNTWRKKQIFMFKPGSLLKLSSPVAPGNLGVMGTVLNVAPDRVVPPVQHPVYRSGRTVFLPVTKTINP